MDFIPDSQKWQCCCFHIRSGLRIWTALEVLASVAFCVVFLPKCISHKYDEPNDRYFDWGLVVIGGGLMAIGSTLCLVGLHIYKSSLMMLSLFTRTLLVVYLTAFGVSRFFLHTADNEPIRTISELNANVHASGRPRDGDSSVGIRLALLILFLVLFVAAIFFTIYANVRAIQYIQSYRRLLERRQSQVIASQIGGL